jgi:hypothetical protein
MLLRRFRQILMELHWFNLIFDRGRYKKMLRSVIALTANHYVVHVHANNWRTWTIAEGIALPEVLELTFARRDADKVFEKCEWTFPTALDMPNNPAATDYCLGSFRF